MYPIPRLPRLTSPRLASLVTTLSTGLVTAADDMSMLVNLRPYINEAALVTLRTTSLRRVSKLFLSMGLRHLLVVESCPKVSRPIAFARLAPTGPRRTLPRITPPLGSRLALFKPPLPPLGCRCHHAQGPARRWRHGGAHAAAVVFGLQPGRHRVFCSR